MKPRIAILTALSLIVLTGCSRNPAAVRDRNIHAGQKYFDQHKYDEASLEFRRALQADPRSADAEYRLGLSYIQLRRWAEAYRAFDQAVAIDPANMNARVQLAELDLASNRLQEAQQQADEILKLNNTDVKGLILKGRVAVSLEKEPETE